MQPFDPGKLIGRVNIDKQRKLDIVAEGGNEIIDSHLRHPAQGGFLLDDNRCTAVRGG